MRAVKLFDAWLKTMDEAENEKAKSVFVSFIFLLALTPNRFFFRLHGYEVNY